MVVNMFQPLNPFDQSVSQKLRRVKVEEVQLDYKQKSNNVVSLPKECCLCPMLDKKCGGEWKLCHLQQYTKLVGSNKSGNKNDGAST